MSNLVDTIRFDVVSKKSPLPGLDEALLKLRALDTALKQLHGRLAGLSSQSVFRQTAKQFEALSRSAGFSKAGSGGNVGSIARKLGLPDVKDVKAYARTMETELQREVGKLQRKLDTGLGKVAARNTQKKIDQLLGQSHFTDASATAFKNPRTAGRFFEQYGKAATANEKQAKEALAAILSGRSVSSPVFVAPAAPKVPPPPGPPVPPASGGSAAGAGGGGKGLKKFREDVAAIKADLAETIKDESNVLAIAGARARASANIRAAAADPALANSQNSVTVQKSLEDAATLDKKAHDARTKLQADQLKAIHKTEQEIADAKATSRKAELKGLKQRLAEQKRGLAAVERETKAATAQQTASKKSTDSYIAKRDAAMAKRATQQAKTAAAVQAVVDGETIKRTSHGAAAAAVASRVAAHPGAKLAEETTSYNGKGGPKAGRKQTVTYEQGGRKHTLEAVYTESGAKVREFSRELKATREELGLLGGDFIKNTAKVTAWTASVAVLYQGLALASFSMSRLVEIGGQMARLDQVFSGVGGSSQDLTVDILRLAAANGRSTEEAMQSAVQWSRLGLTRTQVNEAVRVSLMAANVAELSAAEATEKLQAIMQNYGLRVGDLRTTLGELNQISNTYNVTNADMLEGISRTAAVAKQAGLPLAELMGIIGGTVGATGQTGANIGNAVKSVTTALGNPALQKKLREGYGIETRTSTGGLQTMSEALANLYIHYEKLDAIKQRSLVFDVAGKTQSSRLAAILDNYVKSQLLAIEAQLNLNSAEEENAKIKATLKSQLVGLTAEWERFVVIQGNSGPVQALSGITQAFRNLLVIANNPGISKLLTLVTGLAVAGGARAVLSSLAGGGPGFLSRSGQHLRQLGQSAVGLTSGIITGAAQRRATSFDIATRAPLDAAGAPLRLNLLERGLVRYDAATRRAIASSNLFARSLGHVGQFAGAGGVALGQFAVPIAAITGAVLLLNVGMEALGASSEAAESKLAGFSKGAQEAAAAANAYGQAADLFRTVQRSFAPEAGFRPLTAGRQRQALAQIKPAFGLYEKNPADQARVQERLAAEVEAYRQQGNWQGILRVAEAERGKLIAKRLEKLREESRLNYLSALEREHELTRLRGLQSGGLSKFFFRGSRTDKIKELQARQAEGQGETVRLLSEQENAYETLLQNDQRHLVNLERQKGLLGDIGEIFSSIGADTPLEKYMVRVAAFSAQTYANELRLKKLQAADAGEVSGEAEREVKLQALKAEEQRLNAALVAARKSPSEASLFANSTRRVTEPLLLQRQLSKNLAAQDALRVTPDTTEYARRQEEMRTIRTQQEELERERARTSAQRARRANDFSFGQLTGRQYGGGFSVGLDEGSRLLNEQRAIYEELNRLKAKGVNSLTEQGRVYALLNRYQETQVSLLERTHTLNKEINQLVLERGKEFQRSLLGAGPEELLRKLAALRTAGSRTPGGAETLFGATPQFRADLSGALALFGQTPEFDPESRDLRRERDKLGGVTDQSTQDFLTKNAEALGVLTTRLAKELPEAFAAGVAVLEKAASGAATELNRLRDVLASIQPTSAAAAPAATGQLSPGRGGGGGLLKKPGTGRAVWESE